MELRALCPAEDVPRSIEAWVEVDRQFLRTGEIHDLRADAGAARKALGWRPEVDFAQLVKMMIESDLASAREAMGTKAAG